jgi:uncharacterized protein with FMN-binding domain
MKYSNFLVKLLCLCLIVGALLQYQRIAENRAAVVKEHETQASEIEAYNETVRQEILAAEAAEAAEDVSDSAQEAVSAAEESLYEDGTYEGTGAGFGGDITVEVTVEADVITEIQVLSAEGEDPAYYIQAESVLEEILQCQDTDVDTVSGATFSSSGLIEATRQALEKAVK